VKFRRACVDPVHWAARRCLETAVCVQGLTPVRNTLMERKVIVFFAIETFCRRDETGIRLLLRWVKKRWQRTQIYWRMKVSKDLCI